jgi:hypothetical protein
MIYKNTSIKRVIAKVFTDLQLQEADHRISDLIEYAAEGLEKIGAYPYFINKVSGRDNEPYLAFTNYQCRLPIGFHRVISIAYSDSVTGPFYPMRYSTGVLGSPDRLNASLTPQNASTEVSSTSDIVTLAMALYSLTYAAALLKINTEPDTKELLTSLLNGGSTVGAENGETSDLTYVIQDGWVKTNIASGYLSVAYQAVPIDIDGYPMVPDDPGFIEALYWYITMKLLYPQWRDGRVRDAVYFDAKQSWQFYCKQAYGNAMMPGLDQLKSIKNAWLRLIPDINEHDNYFETLGEQEQVYNHNR